MPSAYERAIQQNRADLLRLDSEASYRLRQAYGDVRRRMQHELKSAITAAEAAGIPQRPTFDADGNLTADGYLWFRANRLQSLSDQVDDELRRLAGEATARTEDAQGEAVQLGHAGAQNMIQAAAPQLSVAFDALPAGAVENMVGILGNGSPVSDLLTTRGMQAGTAAKRELLNGIAIGKNPREVGNALADILERERWRAQGIARDAMLDASRAAAFDVYDASEVVIGWRWCAALSERTCLACLALHGREFPKRDRFMQRHPSCRCCPVPIVDPQYGAVADLEQTGEEWLRAQPAAVQDAMIPVALREAWRTGQVRLSDFPVPRDSDIWGRSWGQGAIDRVLTNATPLGRALRRLPGGQTGSLSSSARTLNTPLGPTPALPPANAAQLAQALGGVEDQEAFNPDQRTSGLLFDPTRPPVTVRRFEAATVGQDYETAAVFAPDGREVFRKAGTSGRVSFDPTELKRLRDTLLTHNHPQDARYDGDSSLSRADYATAINNNVAALRAVSAGAEFTVERPATGWPVGKLEAVAAFDRARRQAVREGDVLRAAGELNGRTLAPWVSNRTSEVLAARLGWDYSRKDRGSG